MFSNKPLCDWFDGSSEHLSGLLESIEVPKTACALPDCSASVHVHEVWPPLSATWTHSLVVTNKYAVSAELVFGTPESCGAQISVTLELFNSPGGGGNVDTNVHILEYRQALEDLFFAKVREQLRSRSTGWEFVSEEPVFSGSTKFVCDVFVSKTGMFTMDLLNRRLRRRSAQS